MIVHESISGGHPAMTPEALAPIFAATLEDRTPMFDGEVVWPAARLRARTFIGDHDWPALLATSVRAVVFRRGAVVVVREIHGESHIQPGGRIEPGESLEDALRREVLEETGWSLGDELKPLGFHHFQHLGERPADVRHRWCDFVQPLFVAEAVRYRRADKDMTQSEVGSRLTPIRRALANLAPREGALLEAALRARASG
jgi:8-oxo-dGTP pyrophosphatase MutT (NUDIX family)